MNENLPPAIDAEELAWSLAGFGEVCCYYKAGSGRPLLLLHSINAAPSAYEVSPFFSSPPAGRPLYAPDLPGFGRSDRPDRDYSPGFYASAIVEMVRLIDAGPVDVLALSTTAEFAARAIQEAPELFSRLVLVSPTGFSRRRDAEVGGSDRVLRTLRTPGLGKGLYRLLRTRSSVRYFLNMAFRDTAPDAMIDYACRTAAQPGAEHVPFRFLSGKLFNPDAMARLYMPLKLPVLVLYDQDPNITFRYLDELLAARSNWRAMRIPDTFGLPHFDEPELTREALEEFLVEESL